MDNIIKNFLLGGGPARAIDERNKQIENRRSSEL